MNRIIKFRGKRVDNNDWVIGNYSDMSEIVSTWYFIEYVEDGRRKREMIIPESVGQFTGLLDKNGKEIYSDDIMKDKFGCICKVIYVDEFARFMQQSKIGNTPLNQSEIISDNDCIIGNLHDNPELIETK